MGLYRLAFVKDNLENDCQLGELPSSNCSLSFNLNVSITLARILFGPLSRFIVVPATSWNFNSSIPYDPKDTSILGLIEKGLADFSPPQMVVNALRHSRLRYTRPIRHEPLCFVYKNIDMATNSLSIRKLVWNPRAIWLLLGTCLILRTALLQVHPRLLDTMQRGVGKLRWIRLRRELEGRVGALLYLIYGISLATMTKYLFVVFQEVKGFKRSITSVEDLIQVLRAGSYILLSDTDGFLAYLRRSLSFGNLAALDEALSRNPPLVLSSAAEIWDRVNQTALPRYVLLGTRTWAHALGLASCEFHSHCLDGAYELALISFLSHRVFPTRNFDQVEVNFYHLTYDRIRSAYFGIFEDDCEVSHAPDYVLGFAQISGLCFVALIFIAASLLTLYTEWLWNGFKMRVVESQAVA